LRAERGANSAFIDFLVDSEIARTPENFMDDEHYRGNIAVVIEAKIAAALHAGQAVSEDGHD